ncbi:hypothetical protein EJ02DRAFT_105592 [Clathrospora elynae]|uniref:Uncharacterized protein n=1 Tax=Clathrospora elynae TaxID=706981 RepID=A0A6A5T5F4_9PLEO|nr:hypothetical protein EJ02DRAFT_105592 [Clathrospora elynae]
METRRSGGQTGRRLGITTTPTDEPANTRKYPGNYKGRRGTLDSPLSNPSDYF